MAKLILLDIACLVQVFSISFLGGKEGVFRRRHRRQATIWLQFSLSFIYSCEQDFLNPCLEKNWFIPRPRKKICADTLVLACTFDSGVYVILSFCFDIRTLTNK